MIARNMPCPGVLEPGAAGSVLGESDEVNTIGKPRLHVVQIVADIDDAMLREPRGLDRTGQRLPLVAGALRTEGQRADGLP